MSANNAIPYAETSAVMSTYQRFPLTIVKGKGSYVWDIEGTQYLDFTSGIATCNLGHAPDEVKQQLVEQLDALWHCSNLFHIPTQEKLAKMLTEQSFADKAFFCNSGAEANEAAIKLARKYSQQIKGSAAFEIVTFKQSFHGRTLATLSATGQEKIQDGFQPLVPGFRYLPFNDMEALDELVQPQTCAVLLELVQGEGGVVPADQLWIQKLEQLCKAHHILLMIDEIQTGVGRTGRLFAYQHYGIEPDVITLAKGLGSGIPIGALLAKEHVAEAFSYGSHGSTFGGNPIATTAGVATLEALIKQHLILNSHKMGQYLVQKLHELAQSYSSIVQIRGIGLLQGIVLKEEAAKAIAIAREKQLLILTAGPHVIRILPPLNTSKSEIDSFISIMHEVFKSLD